MSIEDDILIENYLRGKLTEEDLKLFNKRLQSDSDFMSEFKLEAQLFYSLNDDEWSYIENFNTTEIKDYQSILESESIQNLKNALAEENASYQSRSSVKPIRWVAYAAAACVTLFLIYNLFMTSSTSLEIYDEYMSKESLPSLVVRGESSNHLNEAQELFDNENYEKALPIFESAIDESNDMGVLFLYKGISQTELELFTEAEETFNTLIDSDLLDASKGYWYKGLLYLKMNEKEKAAAIFEFIVAEKLFNYNKAESLLKELE